MVLSSSNNKRVEKILERTLVCWLHTFWQSLNTNVRFLEVKLNKTSYTGIFIQKNKSKFGYIIVVAMHGYNFNGNIIQVPWDRDSDSTEKKILLTERNYFSFTLHITVGRLLLLFGHHLTLYACIQDCSKSSSYSIYNL